MHLQIVTPEAVIFDSEVNSVTVPGKEGAFQMLDHHAPIVSTLVAGELRIETSGKTSEDSKKIAKHFKKGENNTLLYTIKGGVVEISNNKAVVLVD